MITERTNEQQELRKQLTQTEQELSELRRERERETGGEAERLRGLLKEKEAFIKVPVDPSLFDFSPHLVFYIPDLTPRYTLCQDLIREQEEAVQEEREAEVKALKDEIQLVLKKEKEAQVSSSDLQDAAPKSCLRLFLHGVVLFTQIEIADLRSSLAHRQIQNAATKDGAHQQVRVC